MISGFHLLTVDAFHLSSTSWEVNIFGFSITQNDNNLAPGMVLLLVGLFVIIVTQYRAKRNSEHEQEMLESQVLLFKFIMSMTGLIFGVLIMIGGIVLVVNGTNLGPADWAVKILGYGVNPLPGTVLFLVGLIIIIATRWMMKKYLRRT